jgi:phospholipid/cholesterol/gamma-HCH transport system substrate-binding protein
MKRSGKIKWGNMWVGVIVTCAIALLLYSSFRGGGTSIFEPKSVLVAYFQSVNGLVKGAPVWLGGVEVGNVKSIEFVNLDAQRRIKGVIRVRASVWPFLTEGTAVKLGTIGFLGDKYVEIFPGPEGKPLVQPGSVVPTIDEGGLEQLITKMSGMTGSIDSLLANLKDISRKVADGRGSLGRLVADSMLYVNLVEALDRVSNVMAAFQKNDDAIWSDLSGTVGNAHRMTDKIDSGQGSLGRLMQSDTLYANLVRSTARLDSILTKIDRGEGSGGALVNDPKLYDEVREMMTRVNNLIVDIEKNPKKYFKFSVF